MRYALALCLTVLIAGHAQAQDLHPIIGIWEVNLERSTFEPTPRILSATHRYEARPDGWVLHTISRVRPDGRPGFVQSAFRLDGAPYPTYSETTLAELLVSGTESTNTVRYRVTGPNSIEQTTAAGTTRTHTVSADGQTMTMSATGNDFTAEVVFDRVR